MIAGDVETGAPPRKKGGKMELRMNNLQNTRRSLARMIRLYVRDEMAREKFRDMIYGLSSLINAFRTETELELAVRVSDIEEKLRRLENGR